MSVKIRIAKPADESARAAFHELPGVPGATGADTDPVEGALALVLGESPTGIHARASLWLADDLTGAPGRSGLIGHYQAAASEPGLAVLRGACEELARHGVRRIVGPVNGDTWHRYRWQLPREPGDPDVRPDHFFGEPRNAGRYPDDFAAAEFSIVSRYESRFEPDPAVDPSAHEAALERARARGIRIRPLDPERFDDTLRAMHALSLEAFADNPWYAPLPVDAFLGLYAPYRGRVDPSLVRLAFDAGGTLVAYLFGFQDKDAPDDSGRPTRTVCKTIAVARHARGAGLGGLLLDDFRRASLACGARGILHALMHVDNVSMRLSTGRQSVLFKRYALFGREP